MYFETVGQYGGHRSHVRHSFPSRRSLIYQSKPSRLTQCKSWKKSLDFYCANGDHRIQRIKTPPFLAVVKCLLQFLSFVRYLVEPTNDPSHDRNWAIETHETQIYRINCSISTRRCAMLVQQKKFNMQVRPMQWTWVNYLSHHQPISSISLTEKKL